jgi:hypothetical protein
VIPSKINTHSKISKSTVLSFLKKRSLKKASSVVEAKNKKALCRIRINFISVDQYELNFMFFLVLLIYSGWHHLAEPWIRILDGTDQDGDTDTVL